MKQLPPTSIATKLKSLPGWHYENNALTRTFQFPDFVTAFGFMTQVALVAEKHNHHPEWTNVYNTVSVRLLTHDAGGVSELDFQLGAIMSQLADRTLTAQSL